MFEELVYSVFCFLATVIGLAVAVWEVISGRVFDMDGLWLTLISLTLAAVFGGNLAWSFYTGEGQQMLRHLRQGSTSKDVPEKNPPTTT
jgi:ABC-type nickel/cobalt efflux system permease component RcnA